jgi:hypothetical protein
MIPALAMVGATSAPRASLALIEYALEHLRDNRQAEQAEDVPLAVELRGGDRCE